MSTDRDLLRRAYEVICRGEVRLDADCSGDSPLAKDIRAALAMKEIKASEVRVGDDVVLGGEDERVELIRHATYGRIFLKDGNGRWHELTQNATVLCAREDTERPEGSNAAAERVVAETVAGALGIPTDSPSAVELAARAVAALGAHGKRFLLVRTDDQVLVCDAEEWGSVGMPIGHQVEAIAVSEPTPTTNTM